MQLQIFLRDKSKGFFGKNRHDPGCHYIGFIGSRSGEFTSFFCLVIFCDTLLCGSKIKSSFNMLFRGIQQIGGVLQSVDILQANSDLPIFRTLSAGRFSLNDVFIKNMFFVGIHTHRIRYKFCREEVSFYLIRLQASFQAISASCAI